MVSRAAARDHHPARAGTRGTADMTDTTRPLGTIALALSGGGYRAAAFHLGTLRALDELGLLDDVRELSTASGGSIVGALYVLSVARGDAFERFSDELTKLLGTNVVADALDRLHRGPRAPSLIQRAAEVYDGHFGGARLGALADEPRVKARFDRVVVNATHFSLGYAFRFQFPPRPRVPFGNRGAKLPPDAWRDIRLADAVAASSCFPAGFEPLRFPDDFVWSGAAPRITATSVAAGAQPTETSVPLMDGGIYDNQAIAAVLLSGGRGPDEELGLLLASDTDQRQTPYYAPPTPGWLLRALGWLPLGGVVLAALVVACGATAGAWRVAGPLATALHVVATLAWGLVALVAGLLAVAQASLPFAYGRLALQLLRTPLRDLAALVTTRVLSVLALTTKVFMARVRDLGYRVAHAELPGRVVAAHIYAADGALDALAPSDAVKARAERARNMDTSLWMTPEERDDVSATGYATTLASLVRYLRRWRERGEALRDDRPFPAALAEKAEAAWARVNGRA